MKVCALIPARGGSKGVPGKNIRLLGGHPLIAYSVVAAKLCSAIDRVVVTTDSDEIASICERYGAEAPFRRPAPIAGDRSTDLEYVEHFLDWADQNEGAPELVVQLRPTTPFRDPILMAEAIEGLQKTPSATSVRSGHELPESPHKMLQVVDGYFTGFFPDDPRPEYYNLPRQTFPKAYQPNGYIDILRTLFVREARALYGPQMMACVTPYAAEVDLPEDFDRLEFELERNPQPYHRLLRRELEGAA